MGGLEEQDGDGEAVRAAPSLDEILSRTMNWTHVPGRLRRDVIAIVRLADGNRIGGSLDIFPSKAPYPQQDPDVTLDELGGGNCPPSIELKAAVPFNLTFLHEVADHWIRKGGHLPPSPLGGVTWEGDGYGDDGTDDGVTAYSAGSGGRDNTKSGKEGEVKKRKINRKMRLQGPKVLTKNTLLREAQERETLRRELPKKIRSTNVAPPTGEGVMVKKGDAVWLFFERAWRISGLRESVRISVNNLVFTAHPIVGMDGFVLGFHDLQCRAKTDGYAVGTTCR
ncbi:hypothetical protein HOY82DRAFT_595311 [Tuber indicum]|nr:hypothetical protein HOY82DRAFT_595311 [Tuber indicum]